MSDSINFQHAKRDPQDPNDALSSKISIQSADQLRDSLISIVREMGGQSGVRSLLDSFYVKLRSSLSSMPQEDAKAYANIYEERGWKHHATKIRDFGKDNISESFGAQSSTLQQEPTDLVEMIANVLNKNRENEDVTLSKVENEHGLTTMSISRKPSGEAALYTTPEGDFCVDWKEKFAREEKQQFPPFSPGDKVRVQGFIQPDQNGLYKLHVDADGRIADNFFIGEVTNPDPFADIIGLPVTVVIEVGEERKQDFRLSDIWNYNAKLIELESKPIVNPSSSQIEQMETGSRVVVDGVFQGYGGPVENEWSDRYNSATLLTDSGEVIYLDLPYGKIQFSNGVQENLGNKNPQIGDRVTIGAFVTRSKRKPEVLHEGIDVGVRLAAASNDPCLLRVPSSERHESYALLRSNVSQALQQIESSISDKNYVMVRKNVGELRHLELTNAELDSVDELIWGVPEEEQPLLVPRSKYQATSAPNYWTRAIDNAYEVLLESMSKQEFLMFARKAVTGELQQTGKEADTSYLYMLARDFGIDSETRESLLMDCITKRLPRVQAVPYQHDIHWDDKYNCDQAFKYLSGIGSKSSTQYLIDLLSDTVKKGEYRPPDWRERNIPNTENFIFEIAAAITVHLNEMPLDILRGNLVKIKEIRTILADRSDEVFAVRYLERIIAFTENKADEI